MNKKKLLMPLSIALAFLTIVLTSCGGNDSGDNNKDTTTSVDTTTETSTSVDTTTSADTTTTSTSINTTTNPGTTTSSDINTTTSADVTTTTAGDVTTTSETNTSTSTDTTTSTDTSTSTSTETSTDPTTTTDIGPQYETFNVTYFNKNNEEIDDIGSNPTTISENDGIVVLNSLSRVGYTFDGFFTDKACSNKITQIDSSSLLEDVVLYVSFTAIRYNVTFNINATYGTNPNTFSTYSIESDTITLLDATAKTGYIFDGWYNSNNQKVTQIAAGSTGEIELTAKFNKQEYTITLNAGNGTVPSSTINYDVETSVNLQNPTPAAGYEFVGWYNQNNVKYNVIPAGTTGDISLTARYNEIQYTIIFNTNGGTKISNRTYTVTTGYLTLPDAVNGDLEFVGWYDNPQFTGNIITSIPVGSTGTKELFAKYSGAYNITYVVPSEYASNYGENPTLITPSSNYTLKAPGGEQQQNKYEFEGWYTTSTFASTSRITVLNSTTVTADLTLYAHFVAKEFNITYKYYDTNAMNEYHNVSELTSSSIVNNNRTKYNSEETSFTLAAPSLTGYTFDGFYTQAPVFGQDPQYGYDFYYFNEANKVTEYTFPDYKIDITIYVSFKPIEHKVTLKFDGNDYMTVVSYYGDGAISLDAGTLMPAKVNNTSYQVLTLNNPSKEGYTFDGWYNANNQKVTSIPANLSTDLVYTAKMNEIEYSITYDVNGGVATNNTITSYTITSETITFNNATPQAGYKFDGWYNDNNEKVTSIPQGSTGDIELQARYTIETYTISYDLAGGEYVDDETNPTSYNILTPTIVLNNPTKQGSTFDGWYNANNQKVTQIAQGSTGNIALTAHWSIKEANTITYIYGIDNYSNIKAGEFTKAQAEAFGLPTSFTYQTSSLSFAEFEAKGFIFSVDGWSVATVDEYDYITTTGNTVTLDELIALGEDVVLYQENAQLVEYDITYIVDGEVFEYPDEYATTFDLVTTGAEGIYFMTNDGYLTYTWYSDAEKTNEISSLDDTGIINPDDIQDITIYGTTHVIEYNINYEIPHGEMDGQYPTTFTKLEDVTLVNPVADAGYEFEGWYINNQKVTQIEVANYNGDITLTANFTLITYTITYNATNCTNPNTITTYTVETPTFAILDGTGIATGYEFDCWKDANNQVVTSIAKGTTGNIVLTSSIKLAEYTITYIYANGDDSYNEFENLDEVLESNPNPTTFTMETGEIIFTPINVKEGYVFSAFYFVDSEYEEMVIVDPDDDANIIGIQGGLTCDIVIYVEIFAE